MTENETKRIFDCISGELDEAGIHILVDLHKHINNFFKQKLKEGYDKKDIALVLFQVAIDDGYIRGKLLK